MTSDKWKNLSRLVTHHLSLVTALMPRDRFIAETPFFTEEHARLWGGVTDFAAREIEPRAAVEDEGKTDEQFREMLALLAQADLLRYSVAAGDGTPLGARSLCLVREALAYS